MKTPAVPWLYVALTLGLWVVPLLRVLHAESAAFVAAAAFVLAGVYSLQAFRAQQAFAPVLRYHLVLLVIPWALLTLTLAWMPNKGYAQGLLLYLTFAPPSVVLSVALGYALAGTRLRRPFWAFFGVTVAVLTLTPLFDLGLHPQFYHYNHVFGGVLGPVYDEELAIRPGLFAFRALTLLWAIALYLYGRHRRGSGGLQRLTAVLGLIVIAYALSGWLGFNTPAWKLRQALAGHRQTPHFDLYYEAGSLAAWQVDNIARLHEYRYAQLRDSLSIEVNVRIQSYLYPDPQTRARLTGAAQTSVAPVWLPRPQMHVLADRLDGVLAHEIAHAFSRNFGLPVTNASRFIGLVEGLAVALEPPDGLPTPHEQVAARARVTGDTLLAARVAASLGARGFWTGRGAVSYTTMGSFVRYLLDRYGAEKLKTVYAKGDFEGVYGKSIEVLAREWEEMLSALENIPVAAAQLAQQRFTVPSLFERASPHYVPLHVRLTRRAAEKLAAADTSGALVLYNRALQRAPTYVPALDGWAALLLRRGEPARVHQKLDSLAADAPSLLIRQGDALVLMGNAPKALEAYRRAESALPLYAHASIVAVRLRASLASEPEAIASIYRQREQPRTAAARMLYALRISDENPAAAYALLMERRVPDEVWNSAGARVLFHAQRAGWLAETALAAGLLDAARIHAREAAHLFETIGELNAAARWRDLARQAQWAQRTPFGAAAKP